MKKLLKLTQFLLHISSSLTSQWLSPQSMNTYQSCQSRNSFGYGSQLPSAVQSINSFPALSNNIGEFNFGWYFYILILNGSKWSIVTIQTFLQFQGAHRLLPDVLTTHTHTIRQVSIQQLFHFQIENREFFRKYFWHFSFSFTIVGLPMVKEELSQLNVTSTQSVVSSPYSIQQRYVSPVPHSSQP